jgi:hypothetical protein
MLIVREGPDSSHLTISNRQSRIVLIGAAPEGVLLTRSFEIRNAGASRLVVTNASASEGIRIASSPETVESGQAGLLVAELGDAHSGQVTGQIRITSNDPVNGTFEFNVTAFRLSAGDDADGDGINDVVEFFLKPMGFDWQIPNDASMVRSILHRPAAVGLYSLSQIEALNVGYSLLQNTNNAGVFDLKLSLERSRTLSDFLRVPLLTNSVSVTGDGFLEIHVDGAEETEFFRVRVD